MLQWNSSSYSGVFACASWWGKPHRSLTRAALFRWPSTTNSFCPSFSMYQCKFIKVRMNEVYSFIENSFFLQVLPSATRQPRFAIHHLLLPQSTNNIHPTLSHLCKQGKLFLCITTAPPPVVFVIFILVFRGIRISILLLQLLRPFSSMCDSRPSFTKQISINPAETNGFCPILCIFWSAAAAHKLW